MPAVSFLSVNGRGPGGEALTDRLFSGYFFQDQDFVAGPRGFEVFLRAGGRLPDAEDGCYILMQRAEDGHHFSADHCGYGKLFYIARPGFWAVSNSPWRIAQAMRAAGLTPRPDPVAVAAMEAEGHLFPTGLGMFFGQLTTFDSLIEGVRLVPPGHRLRIDPEGRAQITAPPPRPVPADYATALARALGVWRGRIAGLEAAGRYLAADLTGGIDSRTVLALLHGGTGGASLYLWSHQNRRGRRDLAIAQRLCAALDLRHNHPLPKRPPRLGAADGFEAWRDLSLGAYFPVYFPRQAPQGRVIHFAGGGGENQRQVYDKTLWARLWRLNDATRFVASRLRRLRARDLRPAYAERLTGVLEALGQTGGGGDPLMLHYRAFRNRFHAGRQAQDIVSINPLASALFDDCARLAGAARLRTGQIAYDIMENLVPGLAEHPFDSPAKAMGRARRDALTRVTPTALAPGRVFAGGLRPKTAPAPKAPDNTEALERLATLYAQARPLAARWLAPAYLRRADRTLAKALRTGGFDHPNTSKRVGAVAAFSLFQPDMPD